LSVTNNDVLRSLRYAMDLNDAVLADIFELAGQEVSRAEIGGFLMKEEEDGYLECSDAALAHFLEGLIVYKRGKSEQAPEPFAGRLNNNDILKKLRVAFILKEEDMSAIMVLAGFPLSKPELSALFRKKGHKNYRECGDQILRNFLKGLTLKLRAR
jgi:uncharacterized protein YehS (DUF1456 family)